MYSVLQLIILSMDQFALYFSLSGLFGPKSSRYSYKFVIRPTNRFNLGNLIYVKEVTAIFRNFSKGSDFMWIEQYDTELTQTRDIIIIGHWM